MWQACKNHALGLVGFLSTWLPALIWASADHPGHNPHPSSQSHSIV